MTVTAAHLTRAARTLTGIRWTSSTITAGARFTSRPLDDGEVGADLAAVGAFAEYLTGKGYTVTRAGLLLTIDVPAAVTEQPATPGAPRVAARTITQIQRAQHVGYAEALRIQAEETRAAGLTAHTVAVIAETVTGRAWNTRDVAPGIVRADLDGTGGEPLARGLAAHYLQAGYDVARDGTRVTIAEPEDDAADLHNGETEHDAPLAPPSEAVAEPAAIDQAAARYAEAHAAAGPSALLAKLARHRETLADVAAGRAAAAALASPAVTDADRARVVAELPAVHVSTGARVATLLAQVRAETVAAVLAHLAPTVTAYNEACADWSQANEDQDDAPSVSDAETYSERLEECAHAFASAVGELAAGAPTDPPATSPTDADTWGWTGTPDDPDTGEARDRGPAPEGFAVFAHWSTSHAGVNVEVDAPDGLALTVHVNDGRILAEVIGSGGDAFPWNDDDEDDAPVSPERIDAPTGHHPDDDAQDSGRTVPARPLTLREDPPAYLAWLRNRTL